MTTTAYTDGACQGNPGPGGWAWVLEDNSGWARGSAPHTTNQRMEITAAHRAVEMLDGPLVVVSDSTYVVKCFNDSWWKGWIARDWKNSKKEPVANRDLWEPFVELVRARGDVEFRWVKGHSGDRMNDRADELATAAARDQVGNLDTSASSSTAATTTSSTATGSTTDFSSTHLTHHAVVVTGLRPPALGGYDENAIHQRVRARIGEIIAAKYQVDPDVVVTTGLGLGAEQLGAEAAIEAGVPFVAVLPYPDPETAWPARAQDRFRQLLARAAHTVLVSKSPPASKSDAGRALAQRDEWLRRHAHEAVVVWDDHDAAVGRVVRALEAELDDVWLIRP